jgi:peroxiredoxin (alkyl hydroperoxide reductase subunit C)
MGDKTETLNVGDEAPDFKLKGTNKTEFKLSDLKGQKNVVLNFFPAAFSPVCSNQMTSIQAEKERFGDDTLVFGVSVDNTWTLDAFKNERGIDFELLSDFYPHGEVAQKYGLLYPNGVTHRAVIGIDKGGVVRYIDDHAVLEVPELESCALALGG